MRAFFALSVLFALATCAPNAPDPSTVNDLRVLGMQFEPPEVLVKQCNAAVLQGLLAAGADGGSLANVDPRLLPQLLVLATTPLEFRALIADPNGNGRALDYRLLICTDASDRGCANASRVVEVASGQVSGSGDLALTVSLVSDLAANPPTLRTVADGTSVLLDVVQQDPYRGLGGVRVPVVLELTAPDTGEKIYAQKLMPYTCGFFPDMEQNVQPVLPGVTVRDGGWAENEVIDLSGKEAISMNPEDFSALEEEYVVPSLQLQPVHVTETWKVAHYATSGTMSPYQTGGTDLGGQDARHHFKWSPDPKAAAQDVTFWFVVRDGRGGQSWLTRKAHWSP